MKQSQVKICRFPSQLLRRDWDYVVYLPPGYEKSRHRYPIVYLLHGAFGAAKDFVEQGSLQTSADGLMRRPGSRKAIIVTPGGYDSWYVNGPDLLMEDAFFSEFMSHIETTLRVSRDRANRFIGGVSMGGFGALRFALLRPDLFSVVGLMSPAVYDGLPPASSSARLDQAFKRQADGGQSEFDPQAWIAADYPALIDSYMAQNLPVRFSISSGDHDELGIQDYALILFKFLRERKQFARFSLAPGGHDWQTWTRAIPETLHFILDASAT